MQNYVFEKVLFILTLGDVIDPTQIIVFMINYRFRSRIGAKARNYQKIIEMNSHGDNLIAFLFTKFNSKIKLLNQITFRK